MTHFPLVVGLGNPGREYERTRHNVGFMVLDRLAALDGVGFDSRSKWQGHVARLSNGTLLLKPQTFMNRSGWSIRKVAGFHQWSAEQVLVIYDDVALPLGRLRFREKGGPGGHNGIRSVIEHLGSEAFPRLKIGIGGAENDNLTGHVLGGFSAEESDLLENTLATSVSAVQLACSQGFAPAANQFNSTHITIDDNHHDNP